MITLPSNKKLMQKYRLSEEELFKIMNKCIKYYLSEEELHKFILEDNMMKEMRINRRISRQQ